MVLIASGRVEPKRSAGPPAFISDGAFILQKEGEGGGPFAFPKPGTLYTPGDSHEGGRIAIGPRDGGT